MATYPYSVMMNPLPAYDDSSPLRIVKGDEPHPQIVSEPFLSGWSENMIRKINLIEANASKPVVRSPPMISLNGNGLIWRRTINIVQGKFGCHKSRLAELMCSLLIKTHDCETDFLGLTRDEMHLYSVAYVDTERNTSEQFPMAVQQVRKLAGLSPYEQYRHLIPYSLIDVKRKDRLPELKAFIEAVMSQQANHLFILLDVVTDCISDFNNSSESLELFDFLNRLINDQDITFLLIIHENPGTDKARGHTGTEAANKASTTIQIGFEKGANNRDSNVIAVKLLKLRNGKRPDPTYLYFDEKKYCLARANAEMINDAIQERRKKVDVELLADDLGNYLAEPTEQQDLIAQLIEKFNAHENTIKKRLKEIADNQLVIHDLGGHSCKLSIEKSMGRTTIYKLLRLSDI